MCLTAKVYGIVVITDNDEGDAADPVGGKSQQQSAESMHSQLNGKAVCYVTYVITIFILVAYNSIAYVNTQLRMYM